MEETKKIEVTLDQADMDRVWQLTAARLRLEGNGIGGPLAFYDSLTDVAAIKSAIVSGELKLNGRATVQFTPEGDSVRITFAEDTKVLEALKGFPS